MTFRHGHARRSATVAASLLLSLLLPPWIGAALAQAEPPDEPPAEGSSDAGASSIPWGDVLAPLFEPLRQIRDNVLNWRADFNEQMNLWLAQAVTYVGDRIWEAVGQRAASVLDEVTAANEVSAVLWEIPARWTYENPVVWGLWATLTGVFLAFLGPALATVFVAFARRRRRGAPWGDLLDDVFSVALGVAGAVSSPAWMLLLILIVNLIAGLIVQEATVLPGLPRFDSADSAARNAGLLALYAVLAFLLYLERLGAIAVVMLCLVFSGWGLGSYFWPRFGAWYKIWRGLAVTSFVSCVLQNVLFRLGGETINFVVAQAPEASGESVFVGASLGLACLGLCLAAPFLAAGAYAMGAFPQALGSLNRAGAAVAGVNVARTMAPAATGAARSR